MLIISRRQDETVFISGGITITVLKSRNGRVMLGIDAPESVAVMRGPPKRERERELEPEPTT